MFGQKLIRVSLYAITANLGFTLSNAAISQTPQSSSNSGGSGHVFDRNANIQKLQEAPELCLLPSYSGKLKFLRGYTQAAGRGWTTYQISYLAKEQPLQIKDWYQNALAMYQWKILNAAGQSLTASHKDGHICTLIFNPTTQPGFRTRLKLSYSQAPQSAPAEE